MASDTPLDTIRLQDALDILSEVDPSSALFQRSRKIAEKSIEVQPRIPQETARRTRKFLTIGMATYDDFDGCYFTIHSIRLYHPEILDDVEFLIIDNNPAGLCATPLKNMENSLSNFRYIPNRSRQGTAVRDLVFREAIGDFVLCVDSHVLFPTGSLAQFIEYCREHADSNDLLQGPLLGDDLKLMATCFRPHWSHMMYGVWGLDEAAADPEGPPFEIEMQGLGVFGCRREAWPGFNPKLDGFGGEEGYIHEKIRRGGGRNLCLPFLRWLHRFERPLGARYELDNFDRIRNYLLVHDELGLDPAPAVAHFEERLGAAEARPLVEAVRAELASPLYLIDGIYCVSLDRQPDRWEAMKAKFRALDVPRGVRRLSAVDTPFDPRVGYALSHRRVLTEARRENLESVLVVDDNVTFSDDAAEVLRRAWAELRGRDWGVLYLGGYRSASSRRNPPGCRLLPLPGPIPCTHAMVYHRSAYQRILGAVPDNATDVALWLRKHGGLDDFYAAELAVPSFLMLPVFAIA